MKKVLLLGATGTAGSAIAQKLLSDTEYHITLFARHAGDQYSEDSRTTVLNGDAENIEDLKKAVVRYGLLCYPVCPSCRGTVF